jgi:hypothetical protein
MELKAGKGIMDEKNLSSGGTELRFSGHPVRSTVAVSTDNADSQQSVSLKY